MKTLLFLLAFTFARAAELDDLVDGNLKFSAAMYTHLAKQFGISSPFLVGPFTLEALLASTQSGAKGTTAEEIRSSIFLPNTTKDTETAIKNALSTIKADITNSMFAETTYNITDQYKKVLDDNYQTPVEDQAFINSTAATIDLNNWAAEQSENEFVAGFMNSDFAKTTKTVLINNFLMNRQWANPFSVNQTLSGTYYYYNEANTSYTQTVSMMTQGPLLYNYFESTELDAKFLELPFDDGNTTFTIVVPNAKNGLPLLEQQIEKALVTPDYVQEYVQVSLPRDTYKVEHTPLIGPLKAMGVNTAWTNTADLSGVAGVPGELRVDKVLQNSFINIDETGAEAIVGASVEMRVTEEHNVVVDHPFLFYIKYNGIIVFVGRRVRY